MNYHEEEDIRTIVDQLRLLTDGIRQLNKPFSRWTPLDMWQIAFPICIYTSELLQIIDKEITENDRHTKQSTETIQS